MVTYCSIRNVNFYIYVYHFYTIFLDFIINPKGIFEEYTYIYKIY